MTNQQLNQILEKAIWAPSGDNCQPWSFKWVGSSLLIFHDADRAAHPLNPEGVASLLSLGCLLEAIALAASEFGLRIQCRFRTFQLSQRSVWVEVLFQNSPLPPDPLAGMLLKRCTDRRLYQDGDLSPDMFSKKECDSARLHLLSSPSAELTDYIAQAEQLLFDFPNVLPATLKWVRFSVHRARLLGDGLSWRNMGVHFWELPMMPLFRDFPDSLRLFKPIIVPQHRARVQKQLQSSAGLVCVSVSVKPSGEAIVAGGRLMMNAWLALTQLEYGAHPFTLASAICMCSKRGMVRLPKKWALLFEKGDDLLRRHFQIPPGSDPVWLMRTGHSTALPEKSKTFRRPLSEYFV